MEGGGVRSLKRPAAQVWASPPLFYLVPLQFVDNDSSKGQRACTSSHHANTVHRKHFLLLFFFFLGCFTDIYVLFFFFVEKNSCLSRVDIFLYKC